MNVEIQYLPDGEVRLVVPQQPGVTFEVAAKKLQGLAAILEAELGIQITSEPERHTHGPDVLSVQASQRA